MKSIQIKPGYNVIIDDEDYEHIMNYKWCLAKGRATHYANTNIKIDGKYKIIGMHRLLTNAPKGLVVDHINHNGLDNRRVNLRVCTRSENDMNRRSSFIIAVPSVKLNQTKDTELDIYYNEVQFNLFCNQ